ncbi:MAG: RNA methyltransferase [Treponema sp.]|nr:RNA methyltransferase [Treponema sp.]
MRNKLTEELAICGINAVAAAAQYHPESINRLFLREEKIQLFSGLCKNLAERKRPYKICEDEELEKICKTSHHQGVVAMIYAPELLPLNREDLDEWAQKGITGLVLHSIGNDHNFGAIVRSAAFFDAPLIIMSESDPGAQLTTSAYRIAEGGMEHVRIRTVRDTAALLRDASRRIITVGAEMRARQRIGDLVQIINEKKSTLRDDSGGQSGRPGIAVVLGNEETGLPREVTDRCTVLVRIPGTGLMESLNVAQAANLFLYELFNI